MKTIKRGRNKNTRRKIRSRKSKLVGGAEYKDFGAPVNIKNITKKTQIIEALDDILKQIPKKNENIRKLLNTIKAQINDNTDSISISGLLKDLDKINASMYIYDGKDTIDHTNFKDKATKMEKERGLPLDIDSLGVFLYEKKKLFGTKYAVVLTITKKEIPSSTPASVSPQQQYQQQYQQQSSQQQQIDYNPEQRPPQQRLPPPNQRHNQQRLPPQQQRHQQQSQHQQTPQISKQEEKQAEINLNLSGVKMDMNELLDKVGIGNLAKLGFESGRLALRIMKRYEISFMDAYEMSTTGVIPGNIASKIGLGDKETTVEEVSKNPALISKLLEDKELNELLETFVKKTQQILPGAASTNPAKVHPANLGTNNNNTNTNTTVGNPATEHPASVNKNQVPSVANNSPSTPATPVTNNSGPSNPPSPTVTNNSPATPAINNTSVNKPSSSPAINNTSANKPSSTTAVAPAVGGRRLRKYRTKKQNKKRKIRVTKRKKN